MMTRYELIRFVANATGESMRTIARRGFSEAARNDDEPQGQVVDWDALDAARVIMFPSPRSRPRQS
jgi:hypothetical protein